MAIGGGGFIGVASTGGTTNVQINVQTNIDQSIRQFHQLNSTVNNFSNQVQRTVGNAGSRMNSFFKDWDGHLRRINANMVLAGFGLVGLAHKADDFVERGAKMELFSKQMETVSGSVEDAQKDMSGIIDLAQSVPFKLEAITRGFIKLKSAGIEPITDDQGNGPLKSMIDAMAAFGGTSEQLDRAIIAITQMAGKGTVSMEELRQQLGESVPTAMRIAAREMHMTVANFIKDVSKGKITWERFADVFFTGLNKNYAGASSKLMGTFSGAISQLDTNLDVLAKTIFVDTGSMRYFTAAIQLATDKIKEFDAFMKTKKGQEWIDRIWEGFKDVYRYAMQAIKPVEEFAGIISSLVKIVAQQAGALPPEIVGGGLLGYILFGKLGAVGGVALGIFGTNINEALKNIETFLAQTDSTFSKYGGTLAAAATGGLIGYRLLGPYGALAGGLAAAFASAYPEIDKFVDNTVEKMAIGWLVIKQGMGDLFSGNPESFTDTVKKVYDQIAKIKEEFKQKDVGIDVPVKVDMEGPDLMSQLQKKADGMKEAFSNTLTYISSETQQAAQKIDNIKLGDYTKWFPSKEEAVQQLTDYQTTVEDYITKLQDHLTELNTKKSDPLALNVDPQKLDAEIAQYDAALKKAVQMRNDVIDNLENVKGMPDNVAAGTDKLLVSIQNFAAGIDTSFQSVDSMRDKMKAWADQIKQYSDAVDQSNLSEQQKIELHNALNQADKELAGAMDLVNQKAASQNAPLEANSKAMAQLNNTVNDYQRKLNDLGINQSWTGEAERVSDASDKIQNYLDDIAVKIAEIQSQADRGLIPQSAADAAIARLNAMASAASGAKGKMVQAATDAGQAWEQMGHQIYDAIENALGDAIYGLVTKTKSAKEVLVDLWNAVTRAVSNYLAKLIMGGLFGGGSSGGGIFGSLFGANTGAVLSFAGGGVVDGRTGFDKNVMAMRVSRGERVTVETAAQQRANGRGSGGGDIHIHAVDADSVRRLFMQEGSALQQALNHRLRLNHQ